MKSKLRKIDGFRSDTINQIIDEINGLYPIETPTVKPEMTTLGIRYNARVPPASGSLAPIKEEFGIKSVSGTTLTIYGGSIVVGSTEYVIGDTPLGISSDCYVGWEFVISSKQFIIANFGSNVANDSNHIRQKLYHVTYIGGDNPSIIVDRGCSKSISFPANWGDS